MISETKLDESFPIGQFLIKGFSTPYQSDRNCHGGGILLYNREDILSKLLSIEESGIDVLYIDVSLRKKTAFELIL